MAVGGDRRVGNDAEKALDHRYEKGLTMFERSGGTGILYSRYGLLDATSDTQPKTLGSKSGCLGFQALDVSLLSTSLALFEKSR